MYLYTILTIPAAILAGMLIAIHSRKAEHVAYGILDRVGRITNVILIPVYLLFIPLTTFLGIAAVPNHGGALGLLGLAVALLIGSAALFSGLGLGASVALRRKGKSIAGFTVQFAGFAGMMLSFGLHAATAGTLIQTLT